MKNSFLIGDRVRFRGICFNKNGKYHKWYNSNFAFDDHKDDIATIYKVEGDIIYVKWDSGWHSAYPDVLMEKAPGEERVSDMIYILDEIYPKGIDEITKIELRRKYAKEAMT
jgi:hypothetical protein